MRVACTSTSPVPTPLRNRLVPLPSPFSPCYPSLRLPRIYPTTLSPSPPLLRLCLLHRPHPVVTALGPFRTPTLRTLCLPLPVFRFPGVGCKTLRSWIHDSPLAALTTYSLRPPRSGLSSFTHHTVVIARGAHTSLFRRIGAPPLAPVCLSRICICVLRSVSCTCACVLYISPLVSAYIYIHTFTHPALVSYGTRSALARYHPPPPPPPYGVWIALVHSYCIRRGGRLYTPVLF